MSKTQRKDAKGRPWRRKAYWIGMKHNRVRRADGGKCRAQGRSNSS